MRIPQDLLEFMEPGTVFDTDLTDIGDGWHTLAGSAVTTQQAHAMEIPDHEIAVAVPVRKAV
ncbi:hypothetical protein [Nocardia sp. NPDC056000]|uniref:hypothetical protein n=1 Tax=Nocardia sp. NPDC056000 TaxID=3345674 RepID=UPI0035DDBD48